MASAQELAAPEKPGWETTAAAGLTLTSGTKDTFLATVGLNTGRKWERDELAFGISGGYGNDDNNPTKTTEDNTKFIQGYGQYNRLVHRPVLRRCAAGRRLRWHRRTGLPGHA